MRTTFATFLALIGCLLAGPAIALTTVVGELTDRDSFSEAAAPLADDPEVKSTLKDGLTDAIAGDLPDAAQSAVKTGVGKFLDGDGLTKTWGRVTDAAHPQLLAVLRGQQIEGDAVTVDLKVLSSGLKKQLAADGVPFAEQIPETEGSVPIMPASEVRDAAEYWQLAELLAVVLPIAVAVLLLLALAISKRRGGTLVFIGIGVAASAVLTIFARILARDEVLTRQDFGEPLIAFYDRLTEPAVTRLWIAVAAGVVLVIIGVIVSVATRRRRRLEEYDDWQWQQQPQWRY